MKHFAILLILTFLLNGCGTKTATENIVDSATQTIDAMYEAIPKECRNESIENLRSASKKQIVAIDSSCKSQIAVLEAKISQKNTSIGTLSLLILAFLFLWLRR